MKSEKLIEVRDLTFAYHGEKKLVLKNVNLDLDKGFIYGVVGRNSVGKSTLLKLLAGHLRGFEGSISLTGAENEVQYKGRVAAIISGEGFFENMGIGDNGMLKGSFYENFDEALFFEYLNRYQLNTETWIEYLSAGEKMKFYLAFALACKPELLILDEPAGVLDGNAREEFMHLLSYLAAEKQITILMATHLTNDLDQLADYVLFVNEDGTTAMYDRESLNDRYVLLKGRREQLEALEHLVAMEVTETTATAMTDNLQKIKSQVEENGLTKEIATLEDIMYYNHLGGCQMQEQNRFSEDSQSSMTTKCKSRFGQIHKMYGKLVAIQGRRWNTMIMFGLLFLWMSICYVNTNGNKDIYLFLEAVFGVGLVDMVATPKGISWEQLQGFFVQMPICKQDYVKFHMLRMSIGRMMMLTGIGIIAILCGIAVNESKELKMATDLFGIRGSYPKEQLLVLFVATVILWLGHMVVIAWKNRHK